MRVAKIQLADETKHLAVVEESEVRLLDLSQVENCHSLTDILNSPDPSGLARFLIDQQAAPIPCEEVRFLAPIDRQEVWAAGVTYKRSQVARMDESEQGASHYDQVYTADRPELFFKATARRVCSPGDPVRVRTDSNWTVPEPELTLVITSQLKLAGFTIGNDMSARDIEGENPLYLPQAKMYNESCSIGPAILLPEEPLNRTATSITLAVSRDGGEIFRGETNLGEMARSFEELIGWVGRENSFPDGVYLMTGTGIVPPDDFTLHDGDRVAIAITGIGTLTNPVVCG